MTLGHRTNAIYQDAVTAALDLEIDTLDAGWWRSSRRLGGLLNFYRRSAG